METMGRQGQRVLERKTENAVISRHGRLVLYITWEKISQFLAPWQTIRVTVSIQQENRLKLCLSDMIYRLLLYCRLKKK